MAESAQFRMANRLAGGTLAVTMADLRGDGLSYATVSRELYVRHGIEATAETVRSWCDQLGIEKGSDTTAGAA